MVEDMDLLTAGTDESNAQSGMQTALTAIAGELGG